MGRTIVEKILGEHAGCEVVPGDIVDISIDARLARDFGGANVVRNLEKTGLPIDDPSKTAFTFDCNPTGSDQKYAANQQVCRMFARERDLRVFDIQHGIGTHLAIDEGLVQPGGTLVSTDSHANILGAVGVFGQGMGDQDIAHAFGHGRVWFKVPPSIRITVKGRPGKGAGAKDLVLALLKKFGANTLLGAAVELVGDLPASLSFDSRITVASMATEMGAIILFLPAGKEVLSFYKDTNVKEYFEAEDGASYIAEYEIDVDGLEPMISKPGSPDDVALVSEVEGRRVDSVFVGSCTNGRYEDLKKIAEILKGRSVAPGVVLKVVPATDRIWKRCLDEGIVETLKKAGALLGNAGCAGCASGQIGQNGPGEITVSTGNRNFPGKQGFGEVYLASPETAAATAVAGVITSAARLETVLVSNVLEKKKEEDKEDKKDEKDKKRSDASAKVSAECQEKMGADAASNGGTARPLLLKGRVWVVDKDNIDTDMIFHNRHLAITDPAQMGCHAFGNLPGWEDFPQKVKEGDIIVTGRNFGCGSSRQQAVDCFSALGVSAIIARSFGSIYERNAINAGMPILTGGEELEKLRSGEEISVDLEKGIVKSSSGELKINPMFPVQIEIYQRGGLLSLK